MCFSTVKANLLLKVDATSVDDDFQAAIFGVSFYFTKVTQHLTLSFLREITRNLAISIKTQNLSQNPQVFQKLN